MDNELDTFTCDHADLERTPSRIGADQHDKVVKHEDADGVAMSMKHVVVADPVFAGTREDYGVQVLST
jgi:hypothetical protein